MQIWHESTLVSRYVTAALLDSFGPSIALVVVVWLGLYAFRKLNAATRYWIWWGTLLSVVVLTALNLGRVLIRAPFHLIGQPPVAIAMDSGSGQRHDLPRLNQPVETRGVAVPVQAQALGVKTTPTPTGLRVGGQ